MEPVIRNYMVSVCLKRGMFFPTREYARLFVQAPSMEEAIASVKCYVELTTRMARSQDMEVELVSAWETQEELGDIKHD